MMNGMTRTVMRLTSSWSAAVLGVVIVIPALIGTSHGQGITVTSTGGPVAAGASIEVPYSISGTGSSNVASYNAQVSFDAANLDIDSTCVGGSNNGMSCTKNADCAGGGLCSVACAKDPRLTDQVGTFSRPDVGSLILFVGDTSFPVATFGDGGLCTCTFKAKSSATAGTYPLTTTFLEVANADGDTLQATAVDGSIMVTGGGGPTNTPTLTQTGGVATQTPTVTRTPIVTATITRTITRTIALETRTPTPTGAAAPSPFDDDGGCQINSAGRGSSAGWLLLFPAIGLLALRRKQR